MTVKDTKENCFVSIQNPIEWKIETEDGFFVTTKKEKAEHGIGTRNIIQTIKKNHGKIDFYITDENFCVEMIFKK